MRYLGADLSLADVLRDGLAVAFTGIPVATAAARDDPTNRVSRPNRVRIITQCPAANSTSLPASERFEVGGLPAGAFTGSFKDVARAGPWCTYTE